MASLGSNWSFSRISTYDTCPYEFYLVYKQGAESEQNVFAQYGSYVHSILEKYYNDELTEFDLSDYYREHYKEEVNLTFPKFINGDKYFADAYAYLSNITSVKDKYNILGVEKFIKTKINGYNFNGIIDLLLEDKETKDLVVYDHKSKGEFKSKKELANYARQLYLYSHWVKETYGKFPTLLIFNLFRKGEEIVIPFKEEDYNATLEWFTSKIEEINLTEEYSAKKKSDFYCKNLCGVRNLCEKGLE